MQRAPTSSSVAAAAAAAWLVGSRSFAEGGPRGVGGLRWHPPPRAAGAAAAAAGRDGPERGAGAPEDNEDLFGKLNQDGGVPLSDMMALMDTDGDGTISREEFDNFKNKMGGIPPKGPGGGSGGGGDAGGGGPGGGGSSPSGGGSGPPFVLLGLAALAVAALALAALARGGRRGAAGRATRAPEVRPGTTRSSSAITLIIVALLVAAAVFWQQVVYLARVLAPEPAQAALDDGLALLGVPPAEVEAGEEELPARRGFWSTVAICLAVGSAAIAGVVRATRLARKRTELKKIRMIGVGSYGEVWEAELDGKPVAVKLLKGSASGVDVSELKAEFKMLEKFQHDNIVRVIDFREKPPSFVMELCVESAFERIHTRDAPVQVRDFLLDAIKGLEYLHSVDVVHRDLKSHNVLFDNRNTAKLADFGLARVSTASSAMYTNQTFVGTVHYVAPEALAITDPKYSTKSDIYAYAILAWEVSSRRIPYKKSEPSVIVAMVRGGTREKLELVPDHELRPYIEKAWHQDPDERPTSTEILAVLQHPSMRMWSALMTT